MFVPTDCKRSFNEIAALSPKFRFSSLAPKTPFPGGHSSLFTFHLTPPTIRTLPHKKHQNPRLPFLWMPNICVVKQTCHHKNTDPNFGRPISIFFTLFSSFIANSKNFHYLCHLKAKRRKKAR